MTTRPNTLYTAGLLAALSALLSSCEAPSPITGPVDEARPDRFLADPVAITSATSEEAKLLADDGASGDLFGYSVAVGSDVAIVGAHGNQDNADRAYAPLRPEGLRGTLTATRPDAGKIRPSSAGAHRKGLCWYGLPAVSL